MDKKPRFSRISDLIELIIFMSSRLNGVSLKDIQERFNVSRRTAERMRDAVCNAIPQVVELTSDTKTKYWGFENYSLNELVYFSPDEIAFLENLKNNCDKISASELSEIIAKLKALNSRKLSNIEDRAELLMKSEGYAVSQAPNYKTDLSIVSDIRIAIKEKRKISVNYNDKERLLIPLGLIYGEKVFLVAKEEAKGADIYQYALHKMKDFKITHNYFVDQNFDLKEYSKQSFGTYHGEVYDVKLRFIPEAAEDASNYNFHPTQKGKYDKDGSYIVTFKASGEKHIIWNLFKWGYAVDILAPKKLKDEYRKYIDKIRVKL